MLRKEVNRTSLFDVYVREAPGDPNEGDNVSVTVAPRANRGTDYTEDPNDITVAPRSNRGSNYDADDTATEDEDVTPEETPEEANDTTQNDVDTEPTDYGAEDDTNAPEEVGGAEDTTEEEPAEDDATGAEETGEEEEGPDLGDDGTDYSDDAGAEDTGEEGDTEDTGATEDELVEQEKKFNFYKIYMNVYNALENMIETLKSCVKNNPVENVVIEQVTTNLSDMKEILYDYMIVKYPTESYPAILSYYETIIIGMKLQIEILKNNKISLKQ